MAKRKLLSTAMLQKINTSWSSMERLLNPGNPSVTTIDTIGRAAQHRRIPRYKNLYAKALCSTSDPYGTRCANVNAKSTMNA